MDGQQPNLFDAATRARDAGIAAVTAHNATWMQQAFAKLAAYCNANRGAFVTGENLRVLLIADGMPAPERPHAWGAMTRHAIQRGLLRATGRFTKMREPRSHARMTAVYEVV